MKKIILLVSFVLSTSLYFSQNGLNKPYLVKTSNSTIQESKIDAIDSQMFDLYRSKTVDNEITVIVNGQSMVITLLSANKMKELGYAFNEDLVNKGAMMSGDKANSPRLFTWKLEENNSVTDLTNY